MKKTTDNTTLNQKKINARLLDISLSHETKFDLLKESIETNTYCINNNRIAENLLKYVKQSSKIKETEPA